jgi:hypothetical protein
MPRQSDDATYAGARSHVRSEKDKLPLPLIFAGRKLLVRISAGLWRGETDIKAIA